MNSMGERIKFIRNDLNLTQEYFSNKIGIKRNSLSLIESGRNTSEPIIKLICQQFSVSYNWLVNGVEPIYMPKEEAAKEKIERLMDGQNEFAKAVFMELSDLSAEAWKEIETAMVRIADKLKSRP